MASDPRRKIDTVLDALLQREPPPQVVAIDETGLFVSMPATVPAPEGCLIKGRTSALQLVIDSDVPVVVETWYRALREGVASSLVRLLGNTGAEAALLFVDARHRYGVLFGFIVAPGLRGGAVPGLPGGAGAAVVPRFGHSRKDQFAVITYVDAVVSQILGWSPEELIGRRSSAFIHPEDVPRAATNWMDMVSAPGASHRTRLRHQHRDGSWIWLEITNHNRLNDPAYCCVVSDMVDISDEIAEIDPLTGCLNRSSILAALDRRIQAP
jgi:PAS domain S-box-containing protein